MNTVLSRATPVLVALLAGLAAGYWLLPTPGAMPAAAGSVERKVLYWQAPMDPGYRRDEAGKSPMGMDLIPVYADDAAGADADLVRIDPAVVNNLGVRTAPAGYGPLARQVDTVGYVRYDEDTVHHIHMRADGWIERLAVTANGDPVEQGEVLFEFFSPTLVNAQEEYLSALKSRNAGLLDASRERLAALGVSADEIARLDAERKPRQRIPVIAQTTGVVTHLGVRHGMYITPATEVMSIAKLDRVWVLAEVFERQTSWVSAGLEATVELDNLPGERWQGTVDYVYPELDPTTRTLTIRLKFDNAGGKLRPNMFARVSISGRPTADVVHVPREALIRGGSVDRVAVALGNGRFRSQPVEIGIEAGNRVEIRAGLAAGDSVVTSGQFLIDSESNLDTALSRMQGGAVADDPGTDAAQDQPAAEPRQ